MPKVIVFDLGGVIVRICQTWQEAAAVAGVASKLPAEPALPLADFPPFHAYQGDQLSMEDYLRALAELMGIPEDQAPKVHESILIEPYPGIDRVIDRLKAGGVLTGCLSNTNAPHWHSMTKTEKFAPAGKLDYRAGSHELGFAKPDVRAFEAYLALFGLNGADIIYFDDGKPNVEAALSLGWNAYLIDPYGDPPAVITAILDAEGPPGW